MGEVALESRPLRSLLAQVALDHVHSAVDRLQLLELLGLLLVLLQLLLSLLLLDLLHLLKLLLGAPLALLHFRAHVGPGGQTSAPEERQSDDGEQDPPSIHPPMVPPSPRPPQTFSGTRSGAPHPRPRASREPGEVAAPGFSGV